MFHCKKTCVVLSVIIMFLMHQKKETTKIDKIYLEYTVSFNIVNGD